MKLRVGEAGSRFTPDLDVSRSALLSLDDYLDDFAARLANGWGGFNGTLEQLDVAHPDGVPHDYVMQPFTIGLGYRGRHWLSVRFELGRDEIGSTKHHDLRIAGDLLELFGIIGLDVPGPIAVLAVEHQVAQKLHACTSVSARTGGNERAHDLVDLQILAQEETIDMTTLNTTAQRLFAARRTHPWPALIVAHPGWDTIYAEAAQGLAVIDNVHDAVAWGNEFINQSLQPKTRLPNECPASSDIKPPTTQCLRGFPAGRF